jgi:electron transport complex protein RnfG
MSHEHGATTTVSEDQTSAAKLIGTLTGYGAVAGLFIVLAFVWAQPRIDAYKAKRLEAAVHSVMGAPKTINSLFLYNGAYVDSVPAGVDTTKLDRVFAGRDADGKLLGYAIIGAEPGFADIVTILFAYDPRADRLIGMTVLDNKETPGLGDKIVKDTVFVNGFKDRELPLVGVKKRQGKGSKNEIDMITGVTISSRATIGIINRRLEKVKPLLPKEPQP